MGNLSQSDVMVLTQTANLGGNSYAIYFMDDGRRLTRAYLRAEALDRSHDYRVEIEE